MATVLDPTSPASLNMYLKSLLVLTSTITLTFLANPQNVLNDISALRVSVATLDNAVKVFAYPNGTLFEALVTLFQIHFMALLTHCSVEHHLHVDNSHRRYLSQRCHRQNHNRHSGASSIFL